MEVLLHSYLLIGADPAVLNGKVFEEYDSRELAFAHNILTGHPYKVVESLLGSLEVSPTMNDDLTEERLLHSLRDFLSSHFNSRFGLLFVIALLQTFIQNNFTGPLAPIDLNKLLFKDQILPKDLGEISNFVVERGRPTSL